MIGHDVRPVVLDGTASLGDLERVGLGYRLAASGGVMLTINRLRESSGELRGELTAALRARCDDGGPDPSRHLSQFTFNLSSLTARRTAAGHLAELCGGAELHRVAGAAGAPVSKPAWLELLEGFSSAVLREHRQAQPFTDIGGPQPRRGQRAMLLAPLLRQRSPTIMFAPGGSGKSTLSAGAVVQVQTGVAILPGCDALLTGPALILDWEDNDEEWDGQVRAICRGAGIEPPLFRYRRMAGPLADQVEEVAAEVTELGAALVIVDSIERACMGRDAESSRDRVERLFAALRALDTAVLALDHVTGADLERDGPTPKPYGDVHKVNLARAVFELRAEKEPTRERIEVVLRDVKRNRRAKQEPISLALRFADFDSEGTAQRIWFERCELSAPELEKQLGSVQRMSRLLLQRGALPDAEIAEELAVAPSTVRNNLRRHPSKFVRIGADRIGAASHA